MLKYVWSFWGWIDNLAFDLNHSGDMPLKEKLTKMFFLYGSLLLLFAKVLVVLFFVKSAILSLGIVMAIFIPRVIWNSNPNLREKYTQKD